MEIDEEETNDVHVVVLLYQNYIQNCNKLDKIFSSLSHMFQTTKFLKIEATKAIDRYDDIAVPTVCIYYHGKQIGTFIRFTDEFPLNYNLNHIAYFMAKKGWIDANRDQIEEFKKEI